MNKKWSSNVYQLERRLQKANALLDKQFPELVHSSSEDKENCDDNMSTSNTSKVEKVIRDKNTIVQITVHTKPKDKENRSNEHYMEPTVESRSRSGSRKQISRSSSHKQMSPRRNSKKQTSKMKDKETIADKKVEEVTSKKDLKNVSELIQELRQSIQASGFKDMYEFLKEMDEGNDRRKSAPEHMLQPTKPAHKPLKTVNLANKANTRVTAKLQNKDQDTENMELRAKMKAENEKLVFEINKMKSEIVRYKSEYDTCQTQLKIAKESNQSFQTQILEMKQLIAKLTANNKNLLHLVSDRSSQDEKLVEYENKNKQLNQQLEKEKTLVVSLQDKISCQENEITSLKLVAADIKAQLMHGLEGLDIPRPGSGSLPHNLLNMTEQILGNTSVVKPDKSRQRLAPNKRPMSASSDSAIDDPNSERLNQPPKPVFHAPPPPSGPPPVEEVGRGGSTLTTTVPMSSNQSSASKYGVNVYYPAHNRLGGGVAQSLYSNSPPTRQVSSRLRQQPSLAATAEISQLTQDMAKLPPTQLTQDMAQLSSAAVSSTVISRPTSRNIFAAPSRVGSNSLLVSLLAEDSPNKDAHQNVSNEHRFNAAPLDLEETDGGDDVDRAGNTDEVSAQTKSTPATVIHQKGEDGVGIGNVDRKATPSPSTLKGIGDKPNLETKVQDFLERLRQDSLNYSMPEAQSFQGASFHLSLSGDEALQNFSQDTTLTEGRFRQGLESSIDVLSQDND